MDAAFRAECGPARLPADVIFLANWIYESRDFGDTQYAYYT